jgi:hypothetical protein
MITFPCCKCGEPVDVTDLMDREVNARQQWRAAAPPANPSREQILVDHPVIEACHEKCDDTGEAKVKWVRWKRCNVRGCCRPKV